MNREADVVIRVNSTVYPVEAVLAAGYNIIDHYYLLIDRDGEAHFTASIWRKNGSAAAEAEIEALFLDELVNEALRLKIAERNQKVREMIINKALYSASNQPQADPQGGVDELQLDDDDLDLSDFDLDEDDPDCLDDPLGIAVPWEEKFGKEEKQEKPAETPNDDA